MPVAKTKSTKSSGKPKAVKARDFALTAQERNVQQGIRGKYYGKVDFRTPTYHQGANDERSSWIASLRRDLKHGVDSTGSITDYIESKIQWGLKRNERYKKNPGGL